MPLVLCPLFLVLSPNFIEEGGGMPRKTTLAFLDLV